LLAAPYFLDINKYHDKIQAKLQEQLGRPVTLGQMHLKLLPLSIRVESAVIGEDPDFKTGKAFAQAQEVYVTAPLMPLLRGDVQIQALELKSPAIEMVRDRAGTWNFASLLGTKPQPTAPQAPPEKPSAAPEQLQKQRSFSLQDLKITDGSIAITDQQKN